MTQSRISYCLFVIYFSLVCHAGVRAQTVVAEGFDQPGPYPGMILPPGWVAGVVTGTDPDNYWDRLDMGVHPVTAPQGGAAMMRYSAWKTSIGEQAYLRSVPFDLTNRTGASHFRFHMYRDSGYAPTSVLVNGVMTAGTVIITVSNNSGIAIGQSVVGPFIGFNAVVTGISGNMITLSVMSTGNGTGPVTFYNQKGDKLEVYINTLPTLNGATLLGDTANGATALYRYIHCWPMAAGNTNGWNAYDYIIPAGSAWNTSKLYVILVATSGLGNDIHVDEFSIETWPKPMTLADAYVEAQNTVQVGKQTDLNWIIRCVIICDGAASPIGALGFTFNRNGTTDPCNDIKPTGAKLWYSGNRDYLDIPAAQQVGSGQSPCPTNMSFVGGGLTLLNDTNYFWLSYDIANTTSGNCFDAEWVDVSLSGVGVTAPSVSALPGCRRLDLGE